MAINAGTPGRIVRLILRLLLITAPFLTEWARFAEAIRTWAFVLVGLVLFVTGLVRFRPAHSILNVSTSTENKQ